MTQLAAGAERVEDQSTGFVFSSELDRYQITPKALLERIGFTGPIPSGIDPNEPFSRITIRASHCREYSAYFMVAGKGEEAQQTALKAIERGAKLIITTDALAEHLDVPIPVLNVDVPLQKYLSLVAELREQYKTTVIAVTGSVGKTSMKDMLKLVLESELETRANIANHNSLAAVGRNVQFMRKSDEVFIQETGAARTGVVERTSKMLLPNAFVVTNIGTSHIDKYGGKRINILADKLSHDKYLPDDGVAFLNWDDELLRESTLRHPVISFSLENPDADYRATDIVEEDGTVTFVVAEHSVRAKTPVTINAPGLHNVYNALASFAVGRWLGVSTEQMVEAIGKYKPSKNRQNLVRLADNEVYVDCYNAAEASTIGSAKTLASLPVKEGAKRAFVFAGVGGMHRYPTLARTVHTRIGEAVSQFSDIDQFFLAGERAGFTAEVLQKHGRNVVWVENSRDLVPILKDQLSSGDAIAFKASQEYHLSQVIDELYGTAFAPYDDYLLKDVPLVELDGLRYKTIPDYGTVLLGFAAGSDLEVIAPPDTLEGSPVVMIGRAAFHGSGVKDVRLPSHIRSVGRSAFFNCRNLTKVSLSRALLRLEENVFNNCRALTDIEIPDGVTDIGRRAFYRCTDLQTLVIPDSVVNIGSEVISHTRKAKIICSTGSYAQEFFTKHWPDRTILAQ